MYSQTASLFPKQNYTVLSPSFHFHVSVSNLYSQDRSQVQECRTWERGRTVSFLGIYKLDFRYNAEGRKVAGLQKTSDKSSFSDCTMGL